MNTNNFSFAENILNNVFSNVTIAENSDIVNEMLNKYGLNWSVSKQQLALPSGKLTPFYGIVRDDNQNTFSTCKEGYQPFQNSELAELLIRLSEKTGYSIHSGGSFNGGGKVYLQLESPNKISGLGNNGTTVKGYLTGLNSHDGTNSLKWGETNFTVCCRNTYMAALKAVKNSARHTQSIHDKVEQAIREINGVVLAEKSLFDTFIKLAEIPVTKDNIVRIVKEVTEVDTTLTKFDLEKNYTTYAVNRSNELLQAIATEMNQKGQTLWGLFSGVTKYTSHVLPTPKRDNARLESIYTGSAYSINNDAFNTVKEISGLK